MGFYKNECEVSERYNYTALPYPRRLYPVWEIALKVSVYFLIITVSLIGNSLMATLILYKKKMRTTSNMYIVNLAVSDLLVTVLSLWVNPVDDLTKGWMLGSFTCKANTFVQMATRSASSFTLVVITTDRFLAAVIPTRSRPTQHWKVACILILIIWILAIISAIPLVIVHQHVTRIWADYVETVCVAIWFPCEPDLDDVARQTYWTLLIIIVYVLPMIIMITMYVVILRKVRSSKVRPVKENGVCYHYHGRAFKKVTVMLLSVVGVFLVCWFPFVIARLYEVYREDRHLQLPGWFSRFYFASLTLAHANSACNPVLFGVMNENLRRAFNESCHSCCCYYKREQRRQAVIRASLVMRGENRPAHPASNIAIRDVSSPGHDVTPSGGNDGQPVTLETLNDSLYSITGSNKRHLSK